MEPLPGQTPCIVTPGWVGVGTGIFICKAWPSAGSIAVWKSDTGESLGFCTGTLSQTSAVCPEMVNTGFL